MYKGWELENHHFGNTDAVMDPGKNHQQILNSSNYIERKLIKEQGIYTVSNYLPADYLLITKEKKVLSQWRNPMDATLMRGLQSILVMMVQTDIIGLLVWQWKRHNIVGVRVQKFMMKHLDKPKLRNTLQSNLVCMLQKR